MKPRHLFIFLLPLAAAIGKEHEIIEEPPIQIIKKAEGEYYLLKEGKLIPIVLDQKERTFFEGCKENEPIPFVYCSRCKCCHRKGQHIN